MNAQFSQLWSNLAALGARRLAILGLAGVVLAAAVAISGYLLTRPNFETLYTGLSASDVTAIGSVLGEARIRYDVSEDGKTVKVAYGEAARARMLLAEKGLPRSARAGYELFDNIGALGLTSFMQEVTLIRALEGELARTIQSISGVKAARVHIVLPRKNSLRRSRQRPSASVLVRTEGGDAHAAASAIRHLVAGAVPGLAISDVSVMSTDGTLLATGDDGKAAAPKRLADLEVSVSRKIGEDIRRTLTPYLGVGNFQVSVAARLNMDKKRVSQSIFDPASRVERSVREVKEKVSSLNSSSSSATSIEQEIPEEGTKAGGGQSNKEQREKKERLTNYEINSKKISIESNGYEIEKLSVAVVVNRKSLETILGRKLTDEDIRSQEKEIGELVRTASGLSDKRGDGLKVMVVDFVQSKVPMQPAPEPGVIDYAMKLAPAAINSLALLGIAALVIFLGVRPALNMLARPPAEAGEEAAVEAVAQLEAGEAPPQLGAPEGSAGAEGSGGQEGGAEGEGEPLLPGLPDGAARVPLKRLQQMIEYDEKQAAAVIREWLREDAAA